MGQFDFRIETLQTYDAGEKAPRDFDAFWRRTLGESAAAGETGTLFTKVADAFYQLLDVYDVTYRGYQGQAVRGWFIEPHGNKKRLPCVVSFAGYGGGRGLPVEHLVPAVAGMAHFVMDTRGQGSGWTVGETPDIAPPEGSGPQQPGFMTRGIESPETYYYRRVFVDGVRAVETAASHPHVDAGRIAVSGASQGGGIALAVAGLMGKRVTLCISDVPFLCHFSRSIRLVDTSPYIEISKYLGAHRDKKEIVVRTLSYFDGIHFAPRIKARTMMSVGLMDLICPPSSIYAAYNRINAAKEMRVYDFNGHEGGGVFQVAERMRFARKYL